MRRPIQKDELCWAAGWRENKYPNVSGIVFYETEREAKEAATSLEKEEPKWSVFVFQLKWQS